MHAIRQSRLPWHVPNDVVTKRRLPFHVSSRTVKKIRSGELDLIKDETLTDLSEGLASLYQTEIQGADRLVAWSSFGTD